MRADAEEGVDRTRNERNREASENLEWEAGQRSLGQEDTLEEGMAINSCILAWRIPWTEEPGGL